MWNSMEENKQLEKLITKLKTNYKYIFNTDEGKAVMSDLEKRCHFFTTTNIKGDSHESAFFEGQRSIMVFIKSILKSK